MTDPAHVPDRPAELSRQTEAGRYALLRRLAPSMRHHLVVNLQPIGMIYEVMDRRLRAEHPNLAEVHESAQKINGFARAALGSSLDIVTWLAPEPGVTMAFNQGVHECLGLLATGLTFRGYALRNQVEGITGDVNRSAIRTLLSAALIYLTDHSPSPSDIALVAQAGEGRVVLTLSARPAEGTQGFSGDVPYRRLGWDDLQALAAAESAEVALDGTSTLRLTLALACPPA